MAMMISAGGVWNILRSGLAAIADLALPEVCTACGAAEVSTGGLCEQCNVKLLSLASLEYCPRCGLTVGPNIPVRQDGCWACPNPLPRFTTVVRLGPYADPLRQAIRNMKYHHVSALRRRLAGLLAKAVAGRELGGEIDLVMGIPPHWRRRIARGCDHTRVLARAIAHELHLPSGSELVRIRHTPPQVHLSRSRRIENVRGAFAVTNKACVTGARVLLVDDVTTTGATANAATRALLKAGASSVTLAVIAKAESPRAYAHQQV